MISMDAVKAIYGVIEAFFLVYLVCYTVFLVASVTVGAVSLYELRRRKETYNFLQHEYSVPISIIIPAHNEQLTVADTVRSLLELKYRLYEIIVVDDGSTDDTVKLLIEQLGLVKTARPIHKKISCSGETGVYMSCEHRVPVTLITKENGGKADALNLGVSAAEYPYVVCMDADSVLQYDALETIAKSVMESDDVIAVGGLVRIINDVTIENGRVLDYRLPKSLLLCMQVLEYDRSFLASRMLFDKFNGNLIVSGAFGLFRKDILIAVGGYNNATLGEDMELILRFHAFARENNIKYRIRYSADAVCWSQAPGTLKDLKKQRKRWHIGLYESMRDHREILFDPGSGLLGLLSFTYYLFYELLSPYIELFGLVSMITASAFGLINVPYMLTLMGMYVLFNSIMSFTSFLSRINAMDIRLRARDYFKAAAVSLVENIGLRFLLMFTRLTALFGYRRHGATWGSIVRSRYRTLGDTEKAAAALGDDEDIGGKEEHEA